MKRRKRTRRIVFHHSLTDGGDINTFRKYHVEHNKWQDVGYHYAVDQAGGAQKGRELPLVGAHAFGKNYDSIGVCLVGNFSKYEPSIAQLEGCQAITHALCRLYGPLKVEFHRAWPNPCPGKMLDRCDFKELMNRVQYHGQT